MHHARSSRHIPAGKQVLSSVYGDDYEGSDLASEIARRDPDLHILMTTPKKPRAGYPMHQHSTPTTTTNRGASAARHMAHTIPESGEASSQYYGYEYEEEMGEEGAELEEEEVEETEEEVSQEGEPMTENEPGYEDIDGDVGQAIEDNGPDIQEEPQSLEQTSRHIPHNKPRQSDQSRAEIPETRRARDSENNSSFSVNGHRRNSCTEERVTRAQRLVAEQEEMDARELLREEEIRIKRQRVREEQARAKMERQFEYEASRERDRMQAETARIKMERLLEEERQAEIERLEEQARIKLERQREYEANREKDRIRAETAKIKMERLLKEERQAERARLEEEARIEMERRIEEEANRERDRIQAETAMIKMERDFEEERQAEYEANRKRDQLHADQARFRMGCVLMEEREIERKRLEKEARLLREKQARAEALSRDEIEMDQIIAANNARELRREETAKNQILAANIAREIYERQEADLEKRQLAELATLEEKHSLHGANYEHSGDDHTEGGSTQDEDAESVFSDYPDEEEEEYPTDPNVIEEIAKFQATFRGIEKKFRLINKIGEGASLRR